MGDAIQDDLSAWAHQGDLAAGDRAVNALARAWRPRVRRFLQAPSEDEVEEWLAEALVALCAMKKEGEGPAAPRALAPPEVTSPERWRRRVLQNHLISQTRKASRRRHAERGMMRGWSPGVERERWRHEQERRGEVIPLRDPVEAPPPPAPKNDPRPQIERLGRRDRVVRALPALTVRRRVLVVLAMGGDPSPFAEELADALGEDPADTTRRIERALNTPFDNTHDYLSEAIVRVLYPHHPSLTQAQNTAYHALMRGAADLRKLLAGGP